MKLLTRNGKALISAVGVLCVPDYWQRYGFVRAKRENWSTLYDAIYAELLSLTHTEQYTPDSSNYVFLAIDVSDYGIPATEPMTAFNAVYRVCEDNPELLMMTSRDPDDHNVADNGSVVTTVKMKIPIDVQGLKAKRKEIWQTVSVIDSYVAAQTDSSVENPPETPAQKAAVARAIHRWIIENVENYIAAYTTATWYWVHNAYGCLSSTAGNRKAVCEGYSAAFSLMCRRYGINCIQVWGGVGDMTHGATGDKINHAWNLLSLNLPIGKYTADPEQWYAVDTRFDAYIRMRSLSGKPAYMGLSGGSEFEDDERYFLSSVVYADAAGATLYKKKNNGTYDTTAVVGRANNDVGYPVDVPAGVWSAQASAA